MYKLKNDDIDIYKYNGENDKYEYVETMLASGDRDHILSGVFSQFLSEKSEPAE